MRSLNSDLLENNRDLVSVLVGEGGIDALSRLRGVVLFKIVLRNQSLKPGRRRSTLRDYN